MTSEAPWAGPITTARVLIITARALCGSPTFEVRGTACRYLVRYQDGAADDCAVLEREDLRTLIPAMRPTVIDFEAAPDEAEDMAALVAELFASAPAAGCAWWPRPRGSPAAGGQARSRSRRSLRARPPRGVDG
jgi:hypothetical protein